MKTSIVTNKLTKDEIAQRRSIIVEAVTNLLTKNKEMSVYAAATLVGEKMGLTAQQTINIIGGEKNMPSIITERKKQMAARKLPSYRIHEWRAMLAGQHKPPESRKRKTKDRVPKIPTVNEALHLKIGDVQLTVLATSQPTTLLINNVRITVVTA